MFDSPLHPAPLKPTAGPADPFAGRPNVGPVEAAPQGEFTKMFGAKDLPLTPPKPMTAAGPRPPGATNVFQTPSATGGFKLGNTGTYVPPSAGPAPSVGQAEYTTMMSKSSTGLLAEAANAEPEMAQKSFFKKNLPLILVGAGFLVFFIIILVIFAMKK